MPACLCPPTTDTPQTLRQLKPPSCVFLALPLVLALPLALHLLFLPSALESCSVFPTEGEVHEAEMDGYISASSGTWPRGVNAG